MSRDWTQKEIEAASTAMKKAGQMSYEEFCTALKQAEKGQPSEIALVAPNLSCKRSERCEAGFRMSNT